MSTITAEQVEKVVTQSLESFGADASLINREATFESLDIDSLDLAELSQVVEEEFGVQLKGDDMKNIATVGDAVDVIIAKA